MKTGANQDVKNFIELHSLDRQSFDCESEYYNLHNHDLDSYDRKFAIIDSRIDNIKLKTNPVFNDDFLTRCRLLHSQGFTFIKNTAWESVENVSKIEMYPQLSFDHYTWTGGTTWFWFYMYNKHKLKAFQFDHSEKKYDYLYLNKQPRPHRVKLFDKLSNKNILENSLYTKWPEKKLPAAYELPWVDQYPGWGMDQEIFEKPYNDTKYNIVSETNDNDYEVFMTEKIWKPIMAKQVFVVHGNYLYLQKLKEMGFKTFGAYFDESYDLERNPDRRIEKITELCLNLKEMNWRDIYLQTQALRIHNFETFFDKKKLSVQINRTIELFLEFADRG